MNFVPFETMKYSIFAINIISPNLPNLANFIPFGTMRYSHFDINLINIQGIICIFAYLCYSLSLSKALTFLFAMIYDFYPCRDSSGL